MEELSRLGICYNCVSNFVKNISVNEYQSLLKEELPNESISYCGSCLGLMEEKQMELTIQKVAQRLNDNNYESTSFSLAISLPQSLVLRQKSLFSYMKKNNLLTDDYEERSLIVKESLKCNLIGQIEKKTKKIHNNKSDLLVNLAYNYKDDQMEIAKLESLLPTHNSNKRKRYHKKDYYNKKTQHPDTSIQTIMHVVEKLSDEQLPNYTSYPPSPVSNPCEIAVKSCQGSLFLAGRYNKFSRNLSQTPWFIDGIKKTETSVQELICEKLQMAFGASENKFLSSGREDVDVHMLGRGRPFAVELVDPKKLSLSNEDVAQLQTDINNSTKLIAIRDLQIIDRDGLKTLKEGEEEKTKLYRAKIWCPRPIQDDVINAINSLKDIKLAQKTPLRVLHRRPIDTRQRLVHELFLKRIDEEHYELTLKTQAGTYIKEFVHSDFGRTVPSMCSLTDAPFDILELDVDDVQLDWPPSVSAS